MCEHDLTCPDCGDTMTLASERGLVGYRCRTLECKGVHGCHPDGSPFGTPADRATRKARGLAHDAFDRIWKSGRMSRTDAYAWMSEKLSVDKGQCHIGMFDVIMCKRLVKTVKDCYPELFPFEEPDLQ